MSHAVSVKTTDVGHRCTKAVETICKQIRMAVFQQNLIHKSWQWTKPAPDVELQSKEKQNQTSSLKRGISWEEGWVGYTEPRNKREAQQEKFKFFVGCLFLRESLTASNPQASCLKLLSTRIMNTPEGKENLNKDNDVYTEWWICFCFSLNE